MQLLLVGIGGVFGSLTRYILGKVISEKFDSTFPVGTFIINFSGAVLLGILNGSGLGKNAVLLLGDGFLGAYTTFSTFMYEGFNLFQENEKRNALIYTISTLLTGVVGFIAGFSLASLFK